MMMDWNPKKPTIPIDYKGNWMSYPGYEQDRWITVEQPFFATLRVTGMITGRSSKVVTLENIETGTTYPMFVADLVAGIRTGLLDVRSADGEGYLTANWTGSKRGANYGIKAVK